MEWKKEKMSAAELERRQQEYISAAVGMMKRASAGKKDVPAVPAAAAKETEVSVRAEISVPPVSAEAEIKVTEKEAPIEAVSEETAAAQPAAEAEKPAQEPEKQSEKQPEKQPEKSEGSEQIREAEKPVPDEEKPRNKQRKSGKNRGGAAKGEKFGVYTAEELKAKEDKDEGLRKAAEVLEEMTKNTAVMKRLAADDGDPGTTDFPDFSGAAGGEDSGEGDCFREDDGTAEYGSDEASAELSNRQEQDE